MFPVHDLITRKSKVYGVLFPRELVIFIRPTELD